MDIPSSTSQKFNRASEQPRVLPRSAWEEQLDNFLERLNPGRIKGGYEPYTHARLAAMLARKGINDADAAYRFYKKCEGGRSFSRLFETLIRKKEVFAESETDIEAHS